MTTLIYIYIKMRWGGGWVEANPLKSVATPLCGQARLHVHQGSGSPLEGGIRGSLKIVNLCILLFVGSIALWHFGDRGSKCE